MSAFFYGVRLQWKLDLRRKEIFLIYYLVPLVFFAFIGGVFTSIMPETKDTLIQSMSVFGITMGGVLGAPVALVELYGSDIKKAYQVGRIPLWTPLINNLISAFVHLSIVSIIIFFAAPIAYQAVVPENVLLYFIKLFIFLFVTISVGSVIGMWVKSTSKVSIFGQLIFLPSIMISGIMFSSSFLPAPLRAIGKLLPATWGYHILCVDNIPFVDVVVLISIVFVSFLLIILSLRRKRLN